MNKIPGKVGLWAYLDECGVLEKGDEAAIKQAKKAYRKIYFTRYKQHKRKSHPEFTVSLSKENGDYQKIKTAAKEHKLSLPAFLKKATLAYLNEKYLIPDEEQLENIEILLSECLNEIQKIVKQRERIFWGKEQKIRDIETIITRLEIKIEEQLSQAPNLKEIIKKELQSNPDLGKQLLAILTSPANDHQNQNP
jgi:hypothetical protein